MQHEHDRPNILIICTDQQRYDALGCYGNNAIKTPVIDRLATEGVLFESCYVQNPVCGPSRASLMTGRYPHVCGVWANGVPLSHHEPLFTRVLAEHGYDCGLVGKLHLTPCAEGKTERRLNDGFRYFRWAHDPAHMSPNNDYHIWLSQNFPKLFAQAKVDPKLFHAMPSHAHYSHWAADRAIDFIQFDHERNSPFFLWLNFFDPHHPFVAPPEYLDLYDPDRLPHPIGHPEELVHKPPIQAEASLASHAGNAPGFVDYTPEEIQEVKRAYYAMISLIDHEVGRVLAVLEASGQSRNTLVAFTSDHGEMLGDHNLLLKGPLLYEGAVRVPLILRWPGHLPAGVRCDQVVQWMDLGATCLEVAATTPLQGTQAQSLMPLITHGARGRGWALCEYRDSCFPYTPPVHATMLRYGHYKLVIYHGEPTTDRVRTGELYDLRNDPDELTNLWSNPDFREIKSNLESFLIDVLVSTEDRAQRREALF